MTDMYQMESYPPSLLPCCTLESSGELDAVEGDTTQCIKREEMDESLEYDVEVQRYNGPK